MQHLSQPQADKHVFVDECFILAAQARKLSLSASLGWAEEAQKRYARNSDGDAAVIAALSYPLRFRSLHLVVVALDRSSWWQLGLRPPCFFFRRHRRGTLCYDLLQNTSRERGCCPGRHSLKFTVHLLGGGCR